MYKLYTDGATSNNGKEGAIGGWAYAILNDGELVGSAAEKVQPATNNICELLALIKGCKTLLPLLNELDYVEVYSDSAYCINCFEQKWYKKWQRNGWIGASKQPVKNKELWEQLIPFFDDPRFRWIKIKGHSGDQWNELVDKMAINARLE